MDVKELWEYATENLCRSVTNSNDCRAESEILPAYPVQSASERRKDGTKLD